MLSRQHALMRLICPHCQTIYQLDVVENDTLLICHRCGAEFGLDITEDNASMDTDERTADMFASVPGPADAVEQYNAQAEDLTEQREPQNPVEGEDDKAVAEPLSREHSGAARTEVGTSALTIVSVDEEVDSAISVEAPPVATGAENTPLPEAPPPRRKTRIMPWLLTVLLIIASGGFWLNHDTWLDDPWLRSVLLNAGFDIQVRNKDWHIAPPSVEATWLKRGSAIDTVLVITGDIHNRLQSDLPPPTIHFVLYARDNPDERILERDIIITRPPMMQMIRKAPYSPPPRDNTPVQALGKRGFVLVLEDMPQNAGNFTLSAVVR